MESFTCFYYETFLFICVQLRPLQIQATGMILNSVRSRLKNMISFSSSQKIQVL